MSGALAKGFEVEMYTGRSDGTVVGCSSAAAAALEGVVTEPDCRNLEYITPPEASYEQQLVHLLKPRRQLRQWLSERQLTLLPGSTLSLGNSQRFERSDPENPYHHFIEATYGTRVVTASIHINLGITDPELLFAALRLVRCEAALLLALSASSPFLGGQLCDHHSQRWQQFPLTPDKVPLFLNHDHYKQWVEQQLAIGSMRNERHLWTSVRPNGPRRPYDLNRLELRICDLVTDPADLLAITTLLELRVLNLARHPHQLDPLHSSNLSPDELAKLADSNDAAAAQLSLDADLHHWRDGAPVLCRRWIQDLIESITPLAEELGLHERLLPLQRLLSGGNQAMRWRDAHARGSSIAELLRAGSRAMEQQEQVLHEPSTALG